MQKTITLTTTDHFALTRRLEQLSAAGGKNRESWLQLREELDRATLFAPEAVPAGVVRVGSTFTVRDLDSGEIDTFTLSWPEQADIERGRLSVFAPLGTAMIGYAAGDEIAWNMPGGLRRLLLESVTAPAN